MLRKLIVCTGAVAVLAAPVVQAQTAAGSQPTHGQMDHGQMDHSKTDHSKMAGMSGMQGDAGYVAMMIMHHEQGSEMARVAADKGQRAEVKELASKILNGQQDEKKELQQFQTSSAQTTGTSGHDMSGMDHMSSMPEMKKGQQDLERLKKASGAEVDRLFLSSMQAHHQVAIKMSQQAKPSLKRDEVKTFADKTIANQQQEITELKRLQGSTKRDSK